MELKPFSDQLESWLKSEDHKTLGSLDEVFSEKSFAVLFLFLMIIPALPLPTGGLTHVFEAINLIVAGQMAIGRRTLWLPDWARHRKINKKFRNTIAPKFIKFVRFFEKYSKPRKSYLLNNSVTLAIVGVLTLLFTAVAMLSIPFSGLDTLPSLGVVIMALALILEDSTYLIGGVIIGSLGVTLSVILGAAAYKFLGL